MKKILIKLFIVFNLLVTVLPINSIYANTQSDLYKISDIVKTALINGNSKADLSALKIHRSSYLLEDGINAFLFSIPYLCNGVEGNLYADNSGYLTYIKITTNKNLNEIKQHINNIEAEISKIKSYMSKDYSDEKNALILHDYIVNEYTYDVDAQNQGIDKSKDCFQIGGLLLDKKGVCMSYALLYKYILESYGIETHYVSSDTMNHAWNIVKINGSYYHVDVTFDDPEPNRFGTVIHNNFLLSDLEIKNTKHFNWNKSEILCNSFKYDKYFWRNVYSPIVANGNNYYYAYNGKFIKRSGNSETVIDDSLGKWSTGYGTYWNESFSGAFRNGNYIYYNGPKKICRYNIDTNEIETVFDLNVSGDIYGCKQVGTTLYFSLSYSPKTVKISSAKGISLPSLLPAVSEIKTNVNDVVLNIKEKQPLLISPYPAHANYSFEWKTTNYNVVAFDEYGNLIGKKAGKAQIVITSSNGIKKTINVRVRKALPFTDVSKYAWYRETVEEVYDLGLMSGATSTLFKPDAKMNRAMVACVFHRMEGSPKTTYVKKFSDVPSGQYYSSPVTWAANKKIINGYESGTFKPTKNITREEMVTMVANYAKYKGKYSKKTYDLNKFNDGKKVSAYAKESMQWAIVSGVISGKDNGVRLDPLGTASRAECSKMLLKVYEMIY